MAPCTLSYFTLNVMSSKGGALILPHGHSVFYNHFVSICVVLINFGYFSCSLTFSSKYFEKLQSYNILKEFTLFTQNQDSAIDL